MAAQELVATQRDGDVLIIRLANPESRNSLTMDMREQLGAAIALAEREPGIRAVFLTGDGPTFCSGGDLNHLRTACDPWTVHRRFRNLSRWLTPLITLDKPVVVGVNGHAVGGGMGLALTGDAGCRARHRGHVPLAAPDRHGARQELPVQRRHVLRARSRRTGPGVQGRRRCRPV
ncbi:hypothetical protein G6F65_015672 [Rhizopus arrhizus]|nr:hypothetical protein G6F65_015672 [Rhizopus arrhizus]